MKHERFALRQLIATGIGRWLIAWALGLMTVVSGVGLVMVAGWFLTLSAVSGVMAGVLVFHHALPALIIRIFALTRTLGRYGDLMVSHDVIFRLLGQLRVRFFTRWVRLPQAQMREHAGGATSAEIMHRLVHDIDTLDEFPLRIVSPWVVALMATALMVMVLIVVLPQAWWLGVMLMGVLALPAAALYAGRHMAQTESALLQARKSRLLDTLPAITQLLTWGRWQDSVATVMALDARCHHLAERTHRLRRLTTWCVQSLMAMLIVAMLMLAHLYQSHDITAIRTITTSHPATVLALCFGLMGISEIIIMLTAEPLALGRSHSARTRLNALIEAPTPTVKTPFVPTAHHTLILDDVSVKLSNAISGASGIHAHITSDRPMVITGASGAGKSTLLATLAGEIMPVGGRMIINDVDMTTLDMTGQLGFLGQTVDIFDQSLAANLRLGKADATDDELMAALAKVGLDAWAQTQPRGLDTPLGEYGLAISGGQARRVALARLLLTPKAIMLLDEPFAGLDMATRMLLWSNLTDLQKQGSIGILIITSHDRIATDEEADVLVVG